MGNQNIKSENVDKMGLLYSFSQHWEAELTSKCQLIVQPLAAMKERWHAARQLALEMEDRDTTHVPSADHAILVCFVFYHNTTAWIIYKELKFISHSSRGWKVQQQSGDLQ